MQRVKQPRRKKEIRKFKKEKPDSGAFNWDLGIVAFGTGESRRVTNRRAYWEGKGRANG